MSSFKQEAHSTLLIPGPIEVSDEVLLANAHPSMSHVSPAFAPVFGNCLRALRKVVYTKTGQPVVLAGSGTLGWDLVAVNLIEQGDKALVVNSGYFGTEFKDCLETYGAAVTQLTAPIGGRPSSSEIEAALKEDKYKVVTFTHVDTSTGVLSDAKAIGELVRRVSPDTLVVLDGVCSVASEEIQFDAWGIDVVVGASQKGISAPPGLSITVWSEAAINVINTRKSPIAGYFTSLRRWLPIMKSYEDGAPQYFATPPVNLIYALEATLRNITEGPITLEERFAIHKQASQRFKAEALALGFRQVALDPAHGANGMTAVYTPDGIAPAQVIGALTKRNIVIAGGLLGPIKTKYIRFGHMGTSLTRAEKNDDLDRLIVALKEAVAEVAASK